MSVVWKQSSIVWILGIPAVSQLSTTDLRADLGSQQLTQMCSQLPMEDNQIHLFLMEDYLSFLLQREGGILLSYMNIHGDKLLLKILGTICNFINHLLWRLFLAVTAVNLKY